MKPIILACLGVLGLAACGSAPVKPALALANSGKTLTVAASASLSDVSRDIAAVPERQQVRSTVERCLSEMQTAATQKRPPACDPSPIPPDAVIESNRKLAALMYGRADMFSALTDAYGALEAEAHYDARSDMEGAITDLGGSAQRLSGLAQSAGLGALPGLDLIVPITAHLGGLMAEQAQKKRLVEASKAIKGAVTATKAAVHGEASLYARIASDVDANRAHVNDALLAAGLADPKPALNAFLAGLQTALPPDAKADDPRLISASRAVTSYDSYAASKARSQTYLKLEAALGKLIKAHEEFEADKTPNSFDIDNAVAELKFWGDTLARLQAAADPKEAGK